MGNPKEEVCVVPAGTAPELLNLITFNEFHQRRGKAAIVFVGVVVRLEIEDIPRAEMGRESIDTLIESLFRIPFFAKYPVDGINQLPASLVSLLFPGFRKNGKGIALLKILGFRKAFL
jgi:hypothetical protein